LGSDYPDMESNADGSLTIYLQADNPGKDKEANWLPARRGPLLVILGTTLLAEGDYENGPVGTAVPNSPTGTLVADHLYGFYWENALLAHETAPSNASASGVCEPHIRP
jgi:uncharacterized protein DUF1214